MPDLLRAFPDATRSGHGWTARCPAHDDAHASLSLARSDAGGWLLHCHAGCPAEVIVRVVGLTMRDLMPSRPPDEPCTPGLLGPVVTTYTYRDADGTVCFHVDRFAPPGGGKTFRPRRPDGARTLDGVRRVVYRLNELVSRDAVLVCEGEKDCDTAWAVGLPATTNVGGAGKWTDADTQQLLAARVRQVVILPDADAPGRQHAVRVAESCAAAGLRVRIVELPGCPDKEDLTWWLAHGHTVAELRALAREARHYAATGRRLAAPAAPPRASAGRWLAEVERERVTWLWPLRLARGKYILLAGDPGTGKTFVSLDVAARITTGRAFPDGHPAPLGTVVIMTAEDGLADTIRPRIEDLGGDPRRIFVLEGVTDANGRHPFRLARDVDLLAQIMDDVKPALVIIDPITAYLGPVDSFKDAEVRAVLEPVMKLLEATGACLLAIAHLSKSTQRMALHRPGGSVAFVAAARLVHAVARDPQDVGRSILAPLKTNLCAPAPLLAFRLTEGVLTWEPDPVEGLDAETLLAPPDPHEQQDRKDAEGVIRELLETQEWPLDAKIAIEAAKAHGVPERTMRWTAKRLGVRISRVGFGRGGRWLWFRPSTRAGSAPPIDSGTPDRLTSTGTERTYRELDPEIAPMKTIRQIPSEITIEAIAARTHDLAPMITPMSHVEDNPRAFECGHSGKHQEIAAMAAMENAEDFSLSPPIAAITTIHTSTVRTPTSVRRLVSTPPYAIEGTEGVDFEEFDLDDHGL